MKPFPFNSDDGETCPLCGTAEVKDATLIPIAGTEDGQNVKAIQVHAECFPKHLWYYPDMKLIMAKTSF